MSTVEKVALAIVSVAFVTTLILPDRRTAEVGRMLFQGFQGSVRTAMGR